MFSQERGFRYSVWQVLVIALGLPGDKERLAQCIRKSWLSVLQNHSPALKFNLHENHLGYLKFTFLDPTMNESRMASAFRKHSRGW